MYLKAKKSSDRNFADDTGVLLHLIRLLEIQNLITLSERQRAEELLRRMP